MNLRKVLAANVSALMDARNMKSNLDVVKASETRLSNGKLGRIRAASHPTDVDSLEELARTLGVEAWQLLVNDLDPGAMPVLQKTALIRQIQELMQQDTRNHLQGKTRAIPKNEFEYSEVEITHKNRQQLAGTELDVKRASIHKTKKLPDKVN